MATGPECCAACSCCTPLMRYLPTCLQNLVSNCGGNGNTTLAFGLTCENICNFMRCGNGCSCCVTNTAAGNIAGPVETITNIPGPHQEVDTVACKALEVGAAAGAAANAPPLGVRRVEEPLPGGRTTDV